MSESQWSPPWPNSEVIAPLPEVLTVARRRLSSMWKMRKEVQEIQDRLRLSFRRSRPGIGERERYLTYLRNQEEQMSRLYDQASAATPPAFVSSFKLALASSFKLAALSIGFKQVDKNYWTVRRIYLHVMNVWHTYRTTGQWPIVKQVVPDRDDMADVESEVESDDDAQVGRDERARREAWKLYESSGRIGGRMRAGKRSVRP